MDTDTENKLLKLIVLALKSQVKDKKATITCFQLGDISSKVSIEFIDELIEKGAIKKEDNITMIYLFADYSARLAKAIFEDEESEEEEKC